MKTTRRAHSLLTLLVLLFAVVATVYAQDAGNDTTPAPTTATPVPTTLPPTKKPTPAPQTPSTESSGSDAEGDADATKTPKPTPPPANEAAANTPPPTVTSEIDVDRSNKAEYSTRAPTASNETSTSTTGESTASKMTSWLVPSIIAAVIVIAVVFMSLFVRDRRRSDDDDGTPRRTDLFFEHPRTNTNHVPNVPVLGDTVQPAKEKDQSSMRTVAVGGAPHPPRKNQQRPSSPQLDDFNRPSSPGFGTYKQKPMEGSSVVF